MKAVKRLITILICSAMLVDSVPMTAFAAQERPAAAESVSEGIAFAAIDGPSYGENDSSEEMNVTEELEKIAEMFEEEYQDALTDRALLDKAWKCDSRKRVIWAPHHSVEAGASFKTSAFFEICDEMVRLREKYRDKIVFAFKPHPMLRDNLHQRWGKERTETYYADWASAENSFLDEGAFVPLFAGSDAMIHCSGSFIVDYIYTGKPVQYVYCKDRNAPDFGEIGDAALKAHYPAHGIAEIERFIEDVVLAGNDPMKKQREDVYQKYLKSPNGKTRPIIAAPSSIVQVVKTDEPSFRLSRLPKTV